MKRCRPLGDALLASGQAKLLHASNGLTVRIGDGIYEYYHDLYLGVPYLGDEQWLIDYPGHRGYQYSHNDEVIYFNPEYRAEPATVVVDAIENDYIIYQPNKKRFAPEAKKYRYFDEVVAAFPKETFHILTGTTATEAAAYMKGAKAYLGIEGGLHHLAAAVGTPAVVVFGAFNPRHIIGYEMHKNIGTDRPDLVGRKHEPMPWIDPEKIITALGEILGR